MGAAKTELARKHPPTGQIYSKIMFLFWKIIMVQFQTKLLRKMSKVTFDDWKVKFDEDAEVQSKMMRNTRVGKVDNNTAMVLTEVFNPEMV